MEIVGRIATMALALTIIVCALISDVNMTKFSLLAKTRGLIGGMSELSKAKMNRCERYHGLKIELCKKLGTENVKSCRRKLKLKRSFCLDLVSMTHTKCLNVLSTNNIICEMVMKLLYK